MKRLHMKFAASALVTMSLFACSDLGNKPLVPEATAESALSGISVMRSSSSLTEAAVSSSAESPSVSSSLDVAPTSSSVATPFPSSSTVLATSSSSLAGPTYGTPVDFGGHVYQTVVIKGITWMAENLNVGTRVSGALSTDGQKDDTKIEKFCYEDKEANCDIYGGLYQYAETWGMNYECNAPNTCATSGVPQGICPTGWHPATAKDWNTLINDLGGWDLAGDSLKYTSTAFSNWNKGLNTYGFSALPAGYRVEAGGYSSLGMRMTFFGSGENTISSSGLITKVTPNYYNGNSVRCVKDYPFM